jgi:hypothetical protein
MTTTKAKTRNVVKLPDGTEHVRTGNPYTHAIVIDCNATDPDHYWHGSGWAVLSFTNRPDEMKAAKQAAKAGYPVWRLVEVER